MRPLVIACLVSGLTAPALAGPEPAKMFAENCARCHQLDGKGVTGAYPALAGSPIANGPAPAAIRIVLGGKGEMPAFASRLTDEEMAAALTYVRTSWGNAAGAVTAREFATGRPH